MKKLKKWRVRSLVIALSLALSIGMLNPIALAEELNPDEVSGTEEITLWEPETEEPILNTEGDLSLNELANRILPVEDAPEVVSAEAIEENGHVNRLWAQETDLNTIIFQNKDGTKTMYYFAYPVKYVDEDSIIHDKKNDVTELIDKPAYREDYGYVNDSNDIKTYFPKTLSVDKGVVLEHKDIKIEMSPVSGKGVALPGIEEPPISIDSVEPEITPDNVVADTEVDTTTDLTAPAVKALVELEAVSAVAVKQSTVVDSKRAKDTVSYDKVFGADTEIRYTPQFNGFKEDIILSTYTGVNEFTFRIKTNGLSLVANEYGDYSFLDPLTGEVRAQLGNLLIYDSKPWEIPDEIINESVSHPTEEDLARKKATLAELLQTIPLDESDELVPEDFFPQYNHRYIVNAIKPDSEYFITIVVDESYLLEEDRIWPVIVDPNITVSGSGTSKTIQDAPIYSNRPTTTYGGPGNNYAVVGYQGSNGVGRTLMKFPGLASNVTYKNLSANQITNLSLHIYEGSGLTTNSCIDLWQYTGTNWTETTAKCNNIGWNSYSNNFAWNFFNCSGWQTFNMTSMVATWKNGSGTGSALDKGIMLTNYTSESSTAYRKDFMTTESSNQPYLSYTYTNAPTGITINNKPSNNTMNVNDSRTLSVSVSPSGASSSVTWSSSNTGVATINSYSGLICTSKPGTTIIKATSTVNTNVNANFTLTVTNFKEGTSTTPENSNAISSWTSSQNSFNTIDWSLQYELWYTTAMSVAYGGGMLGNTDAKELFLTFLSCGQTSQKSVALNRMIIESHKANENFVKDANSAIIAAEISLSNKTSASLSTVSEFTYSNLSYDSSFTNLVNNWHLAIGAYRTWITASVSRSGNNYTMTLQYNLRDIYDWNPDNTNMGLIVSQSQMHTLHQAGMAREYKVVGNVAVKITWSAGQKLGSGATWSYV